MSDCNYQQGIIQVWNNCGGQGHILVIFGVGIGILGLALGIYTILTEIKPK
jgi:hypothetical protein